MIKNCPVTVEDIDNTEKILGKNISYLKGKTTRSRPKVVKNDQVEIPKELKEKQVMISGNSGVGKTTLVNSLDPTLTLRTGEISKVHEQGKHTTTFAEMYDLSFDARIIDTPGIKGFGIVDMEKEEISG